MPALRPFARTILRAPFRSLPAAIAIGAATVLAPLASGQDRPAAARPATAGKPVPVLLVEHAGAASIFVDPKDQALKNALAMLPDRIRELPAEIPAMGALPMPVIDLLVSALTKPGRFAVTYNADDQSGGAFGAGAVLSLGPSDEKTTSQMHETISQMMAQSPLGAQIEESTRFKGMSEAPTPVGGLLRFGPRKAADGWRYEIHFGTAPDPDAAFTALPAAPQGAPADFKPTFRARLDLAPLEPFAQMIAAMGGKEGGAPGQPNPKMILDRLRKSGLIGKDAVKYSYLSGATKEGQVSYIVAEGMKKFAEAQGLTSSPIGDKELNAIPADATIVIASKSGWSAAMMSSIEEGLAAAPPLAEHLQKLKEETGVDPIKDLLGQLGGTVTLYMSETTGGGDLGSGVALFSLKDRAKFQAAHDKLAAHIMEHAAASPIGGHVRIRQWSQGGSTFNTLTFPGVPVPMELTAAFQGDWLVVGVTPQAAVAAAEQIARGKSGLKDNKSFAAVYPRDNRAVSSISFVDTPRVMRSGYQYISMFGSAVANLARSAVDADAPDREPGLVVPLYSQLREGARPIISFTYWRGDDLVTEAHADRSMLVNASGAIGAASPAFPFIGALLGAAGAAAQGRQFPGMPHPDGDADMILFK